MTNTPIEPFDHKSFLANLTSRPGVYQMVDNEGGILYVGKARHLKSRVSSYFRASGLTSKTLTMVNKIHDIRVTVTRGETEALLLEQNLIKSLRPPYNIQLRDDKSYPYILLSEGSEYPRLSFYRGSRRRKGRFFGPYPSANATRETLQLLQKVFRVRQCNDSYFKNRSRPCLQYQIDRCTGPCVNLISPEQYAQDVEYSVMFLQGKSSALTKKLTASMEQAAEMQEFEKAATVRDQISDLRRIQEQQYVSNQGGDADVLAAAILGPNFVVHVIYVRNGRIIGSKGFFPRLPLASEPGELLSAFIAQVYLADDKAANIPPEIIVSEPLQDSAQLQTALSFVANKKIRLGERVRGHRAKWLELARTNAKETLQSKLASKQSMLNRFTSLQTNLSLDFTPERIECFDISHTGGESTVGSCVVFDQNGPVKSDYRRFNVAGITPGDDYAAMEQVLDRRFTRLSKGEGKIPGVLLIDGGKGQLTQAKEILEKHQLPEIVLVGIAKGISRRAGQETLFLSSNSGYQEIVMKTDSPGLHLLQQIRDEAHRFAITGHRQRRSKARRVSNLESIPGLGPKRRRELLTHFGGQQAIMKASQDAIGKVDGISKKLAEIIYAELHNID